MKLLIDADACPVVDLCLAQAKARGVEAVLFCDTAHQYAREGVRTVVAGKGADSADFALLSHAQPGDVVVTQDYGLAPLGRGGMRPKGPKKRTAADDEAFLESLCRVLDQRL